MTTNLHTVISIPLNNIQLEEIERAANSTNRTIVEFIKHAATTVARSQNRQGQECSQSAEWYHASNNPVGEQNNDVHTV